MTALARDKTRRYGSCGQFGQKLRSLRYSLDATVGDPATELAKIIDSTEELERLSKPKIAAPRPSGRFDFDGAEATVIRIRTADAFSARDNDQSISQARMVIDKFEEEETRLANLSSDQMRMLRNAAPSRDSAELTAEGASMMRRARRDSDGDDEMTRAREPLDLSQLDSYQQPFDTPGESTRLIAPRDRRTPPPGTRTTSPPRTTGRPATVPPPAPNRARGPTPGPPLPGMPLPPAMSPMPQPPQPLPPTLPGNSPPHMPMGGQGAPPFMPSQNAGGYPGWGPPIAAQRPVRDATPTAKDSFDQPMFANRASAPQVAGFTRPRKQGIKPWILIIGALIMAALAFAITRAFIS